LRLRVILRHCLGPRAGGGWGNQEMSPTIESSPRFQIEERRDDDGALRLALIGELDLAFTDELGRRLRALQANGVGVRLDLARLEFIDSTGVRELIRSVSESRRNGWPLQICGQLTEPVRRVVDLVGVAPQLWPDTS
jgi:anti-anti-sigma factor